MWLFDVSIDHHHQILQLLVNTFPQAGENCIAVFQGFEQSTKR